MKDSVPERRTLRKIYSIDYHLVSKKTPKKPRKPFITKFLPWSPTPRGNAVDLGAPENSIDLQILSLSNVWLL